MMNLVAANTVKRCPEYMFGLSEAREAIELTVKGRSIGEVNLRISDVKARGC